MLGIIPMMDSNALREASETDGHRTVEVKLLAPQ